MKLLKILKHIIILNSKNMTTNPEISMITQDSRKVEKNGLFIAVRGFDTDGHKYIEKAITNGARAVLYDDQQEVDKIINTQHDIIWVHSENSRKAVNIAADNFYNHPSHYIKIVAVTGTNGKTTIATLLYRLFKGLGYECGLLSTIANYVGDKKFHTINTTPDPIIIFSLLREMIDNGCEYCFMEVSSHSLHQERIAQLEFNGGIFTNITHDHLDYHKTFAEYIRCKKLLFDQLGPKTFALTNIDDKNGEVMIQNTKADTYTYSIRSKADFMVKIIEKSMEGYLLSINKQEVWTRFIGDHNAHNLIAVYGTAILLGAKKDEILTEISKLTAVAGRLEYIKGPNNITAVVDYAHTPDALENVLNTLRDISKTELTTVFGCGGDRDRTKRPEMAKIGADLSDKAIVTSDNPRNEDPKRILEDMRKGLSPDEMRKCMFIADRKEAIRAALISAQPNSIVLIAGKGHEDYQIIKGTKYHFDDKEVINDTFKELKQN
ncbi:MAG: UDP-N-acetylmuramoyl-L-alanyl-D-glutamate--2,6-diaminopimelate ligase [Bacteroidales bacterium]